jgi:hypothetical protein
VDSSTRRPKVDEAIKDNSQDLIRIATDLHCGMSTRGFARSSGITMASEWTVRGDRSPTLSCHTARFLSRFAR